MRRRRRAERRIRPPGAVAVSRRRGPAPRCADLRASGATKRSAREGGNDMRGTVMGRTLAQKIWDAHVVRSADGEPDLLYIDLHLVHEVTSPQAFDGLRIAGRGVRRPDLTVATEDH